MITGIDLVAMQLWVAGGEKLPFNQRDITFNGHSIEVRLNAEKPDDGFKPSPGHIPFVHFPGGPHVRIDSYLYSGGSVVPFYDSMMGKLIVHHDSRDLAIHALNAALDELVIEGIDHNQGFLKRLIASSSFIQGDYHTGFIPAFLSRRLP
jgi:acetyl-CoA carboxylase biotin carboxylase subunit